MQLRALGLEAPDFDDFWEIGELELPLEAGSGRPLREFRADPERHPLQTPSGRIEIYSPTIASFGYVDCPGHPVWLEPAEWLGSRLSERFPLQLIANQPASRLHSQLDFGSTSLRSKVGGREPLTDSLASAALIIAFATRSLIDPVGFCPSSFA